MTDDPNTSKPSPIKYETPENRRSLSLGTQILIGIGILALAFIGFVVFFANFYGRDWH